MGPRLLGLETEYGFIVEGRGADGQVDDAVDLVRGYPGSCLATWDYRHESPRRDLRGFSVGSLSHDPVDARFDKPGARPAHEIRADRILPNGARFYNDHGHPEYAVPECLSLDELVLHDLAGEQVVALAAAEHQRATRRRTRVFKNNTDFHGASYGTHESNLVPRSLGFERVYAAVLPVLVARQVLTGAGKVGAESGRPCDFQISQRADFLTAPLSVETLFRRPVFNTRDEPHADEQVWIRLHVICGDANMMPGCTRRKVGLVRLALTLLEQDRLPTWRLSDPVASFQAVSRSPLTEGRVDLEGGSWTTPRAILEGYLCAAQDAALGDPELGQVVEECLALGEHRFTQPDAFRREVDWAAKHWLLEQFREAEGVGWEWGVMRSLDLSYHDLDEDESLYFGMVQAGEVAARPKGAEARRDSVFESTRARARGVAVSKFSDHVVTASWGSLTMRVGGQVHEIPLLPDRCYSPVLEGVESVEEFLKLLAPGHDQR